MNKNHHRDNGNPEGEALFCRTLLVIYQQNKSPTRLIAQASKTVKTNSSGEYLFKPLGAGKYSIRVTKPGFTDFEALDVEVKLGDITNLNVELRSE